MNEFRRLAAKIDQHMQQLAAQGVSEAHAIINRMMGYGPDLHRIWVGTSDQQLMALSREFPGFYRYARIMEEASEAERRKASRPYDGMAEFSDALIHERIKTTQPFAAFGERGILVVPYFERALYQMRDAELTPEQVLTLARACEQRILGVAVGPRPLLSIPHLLNQESAASYHGYLLANMAVYQTRAYFERQYGYLTDNPAVGPALSEHYWARGNGISHNDTLLSLTGEPFNAKYLADSCNQTVEQAWEQAQAQMASAANKPLESQ